MSFCKSLARLQFCYNKVFYDNICQIKTNLFSFIPHIYRYLITCVKSHFSQLNKHCPFIHLFQKTVTQSIVYFVKSLMICSVSSLCL